MLLYLHIWDIHVHLLNSLPMSTQQPDAKMEEIIDYGNQAEQQSAAKIDRTATEIPLVLQPQIYPAS